MSSRATALIGMETTAASDDADIAAHIRLHLVYAWRHRRRLRLSSPTLFTELVQLRKLHDRDARLPMLADKVKVKDFVAETIGREWVIPTLWHGLSLPDYPSWPLPFVAKSRHGCNQRAFVRTEAEDWDRIRRQADRWMKGRYGAWLDEWTYRDIDKGILIEPFIGIDGELPVDYKLYVFHGRVEFVQVHLGRKHAHRWIILDRQWRWVTSMTRDPDPRRPMRLDAMIEAAEALARGFSFVRADFYEIEGKPLFGELTFYPGSGLNPFDPVGLDARMGALWRSPSMPPPIEPDLRSER